MESRKRVKVFDPEGNELNVPLVDAREIVAAGGSYEGTIPEKKKPESKPHLAEAKVDDPVIYSEADAIAQNDGEDVNAKKKGKK